MRFFTKKVEPKQITTVEELREVVKKNKTLLKTLLRRSDTDVGEIKKFLETECKLQPMKPDGSNNYAVYRLGNSCIKLSDCNDLEKVRLRMAQIMALCTEERPMLVSGVSYDDEKFPIEVPIKFVSQQKIKINDAYALYCTLFVKNVDNAMSCSLYVENGHNHKVMRLYKLYKLGPSQILDIAHYLAYSGIYSFHLGNFGIEDGVINFFDPRICFSSELGLAISRVPSCDDLAPILFDKKNVQKIVKFLSGIKLKEVNEEMPTEEESYRVLLDRALHNISREHKEYMKKKAPYLKTCYDLGVGVQVAPEFPCSMQRAREMFAEMNKKEEWPTLDSASKIGVTSLCIAPTLSDKDKACAMKPEFPSSPKVATVMQAEGRGIDDKQAKTENVGQTLMFSGVLVKECEDKKETDDTQISRQPACAVLTQRANATTYQSQHASL